MIIYSRDGAPGRPVAARIYMREDGIVLRLFLNDLDKHRAYLESAPPLIRDVFTGAHADCRRCHNEKEGRCRFRKSYTLFGRRYDKCNGVTFEFGAPTLEKLPAYMDLLREFYPARRRGARQ